MQQKSEQLDMSPFRLGKFLIEPQDGAVSCAGITQHVPPREMDLLVCLKNSAGTTVTRDELISRVWRGAVVSDDAIQRSISQLRRTLGDNARHPIYIETVPKRGYRLLHKLNDIQQTQGLNNRKNSRSTGRIRATPSRFSPGRVTLWAISCVLCIALIKQNMKPGSAPINMTADSIIETLSDQRHQRARVLYGQYQQDSNESAISLYRLLLEENPEDASAWAGLSKALSQKYYRWTRNQSDIDLAIEHANTAIQLDASDVDAFWALGIASHYQGDLAAASSAYIKAFGLAPHSWQLANNVAALYRKQEQYNEAIIYYRKAMALADDPIQFHNRLADIYNKKGDLEQTAYWYRQALELDPLNDEATAGLASLKTQEGHYDLAMALCKSVIERLKQHSKCALTYGKLLIEQDRYEEAFQHFSNVDTDQPKYQARFETYKLIAEIRSGYRLDADSAILNLKNTIQYNRFLSSDSRASIFHVIENELKSYL